MAPCTLPHSKPAASPASGHGPHVRTLPAPLPPPPRALMRAWPRPLANVLLFASIFPVVPQPPVTCTRRPRASSLSFPTPLHSCPLCGSRRRSFVSSPLLPLPPHPTTLVTTRRRCPPPVVSPSRRLGHPRLGGGSVPPFGCVRGCRCRLLPLLYLFTRGGGAPHGARVSTLWESGGGRTAPRFALGAWWAGGCGGGLLGVAAAVGRRRLGGGGWGWWRHRHLPDNALLVAAEARCTARPIPHHRRAWRHPRTLCRHFFLEVGVLTVSARRLAFTTPVFFLHHQLLWFLFSVRTTSPHLVSLLFWCPLFLYSRCTPDCHQDRHGDADAGFSLLLHACILSLLQRVRAAPCR